MPDPIQSNPTSAPNSTSSASPATQVPSTTPAPASSPTPAATSTPAAASPARYSADLSAEQARELLNFDPFSPASSSPPDVNPGTPPAVADPVPAAPAAPVVDPEVQLLRAQLAAAKAAASTAPAAPVTPSAPAAAPVDETPPYAFQIPPQLIAALESEDPAQRQTAYGALMTGTARAVHQTMQQQFNAKLLQVVEALPQFISQHVTAMNAQHAVFEDFYGKYKELNIPALRPTILAIARQVMNETGATEWSEAVRDTIAKRVYGVIGVLAKQPDVRPNGGFSPNGGVRPAVGGTPVTKDIMDTLF